MSNNNQLINSSSLLAKPTLRKHSKISQHIIYNLSRTILHMFLITN